MIRAIIMAGGEGTRLRPLTCNRAKPMTPVINKPVIEHAVELLKKHNIRDIVISLFYLPENVQNYFGDGTEWNVNISYSVEENPLGTAGGVRLASRNFDDTFIVLSGDGIIDFDLTDIIRFHKEKKSPFTIALKRVHEPTEYGIVITNRETGKIEKFLEKPSWSEVFSDNANTGVYVIEPSLMEEYVPVDTNLDFSFDLFPKFQKENVPLYGYITDGYWCDVGNIYSYMDVHRDILDHLVNIDVPGKMGENNVWIGKNVEIDPGAILKGPIILGDFVKVKKNAEISEFSVIGNNCVIEEGASVRRSIILNSTVIGPKSELRGVIVGKRCFIEQNVAIYENAVISDDVQVGAHSEIPGGRRVWPDKIIEPGTRLTRGLIWGQTEKKSLFGSSGITGSFNVRITPEFSAKLGSAIGAYLGIASRVTISRDAAGSSRLIKRAITSGLLSMGVDLYDLEIESLPITRFATRFIKTDLCIHVQTQPQDGLQYIVIHLFDRNGFRLLLKAEKKLENIFYRGDYPRKSAFEVGQLHYSTHHIESYLDFVKNHIDFESVYSHKIPLMLDCSNGAASYIFPDLLSFFGCSPTTFRGQIQYQDVKIDHAKEAKRALKTLRKMCEANREIGAMISSTGDRITVFDEKGDEVSTQEIFAFLCIYYVKYRNARRINLPLNASQNLEKFLQNEKVEIVRISTKQRSPLHTSEVFIEAEEGVYPHLIYEHDVMFSLIVILEYLVKEKKKLVDARKDLPALDVAHSTIECTLSDKAAIMREMTELANERLELKDGVRVVRDDSWILILPDAVQPLIHLYAEGSTGEKRDEITREFSRKIKALFRMETSNDRN